MATITETQTVEETLTFTAKPSKNLQKPQILKPQNIQKTEPQLCSDCPECNKQNLFKSVPILSNAIGIIVAILATYMIVSTDSNLYLVFWVCYSVLRRMMKPKPSIVRVKAE